VIGRPDVRLGSARVDGRVISHPAVGGNALTEAGTSHRTVPDRLTVWLPADARVLVWRSASGQRATVASRSWTVTWSAAGRLAGPGAVVLNGNVVELWGEPAGTVEAALDAHPGLTGALRAFAAQPGAAGDRGGRQP
jgi:hypothetical protein